MATETCSFLANMKVKQVKTVSELNVTPHACCSEQNVTNSTNAISKMISYNPSVRADNTSMKVWQVSASNMFSYVTLLQLHALL